MTRCKLLVLLALLVALGLRLLALGHSSLWADEAFTLLVGRMSLGEIWRHSILNDFNPPLIYLLYRLWIPLMGWLPIESGARLLPVLIDVAAIYVAARIFHERIGCEAAAVAAWLMAVSPLEIEAARTARGYSLMLLFSILCLHYADRFFAENAKAAQGTEKAHPLTGKSATFLTLSGAALVLTLYTHYYGFFLFPAIFVLAILHKRPLLTAYFLLPALVFIPWWPAFAYHLLQGNPMIQPLTLHRLVRSGFALFTGQTFFLNQPGLSTLKVGALALLLAFVVWAGMTYVQWLRARDIPPHLAHLKSELPFLSVVALFAPVQAVALSLAVRGFEEFYFVMALAGLFGLIAVLWKYVRSVAPGRPAGPFFLLLLVPMIGGVVPIYGYEHQEWREGVEWVNQRARGNDILLANIRFDSYPIELYYSGPASYLDLTEETYDETELARVTRGCDSVWLVGSYDPALPENRLRRWLTQHLTRLDQKVWRRVFVERFACRKSTS